MGMSLTGITMLCTPFLPGPEDEAFLLPHLPAFAPFQGPQNDGATYICTYIHTYIHMYIHTYIHTYVRTIINTLVSQCTMLQPRAANTSNANPLTLH